MFGYLAQKKHKKWKMLGAYINALETAAEIGAIGRAGSRKPWRFQKPVW